jgi:type I restriction enzyme, S subunit
MIAQVPLFEAPLMTSKEATQVEEIVGHGLDVRKFVENFGDLTEAMGGLGHLRWLILELAVRGRLVEQLPSEGSGVDALRLIESHERRLIQQGALRRPAEVLPTQASEQLFAIPKSWVWTRFGRLGDWGAGATPSRSQPAYFGGATPWFKSGELNDGYIDDSEEHVTQIALQECSLRLNQPGDVMIAMYGATIGKVALARRLCTTNQAVCACTCHEGASNEFVFRLLKAFRYRFVEQGAGGAQPNISKVKIVAMPCPLPPLAEQKRIVAKVDQLMNLSDELEAQQSKKRETGTRLTKSALKALTSAEGPEEFDDAWTRVADNFDVLVDRSEKVKELRKTILSLAVRGRLVRTNEEGQVEDIIARIQEKRATLAAGRKTAGQVDLPAVRPEDVPFPIPSSWRWTRLGLAAICRDSQRIPVSKEERAKRRGHYDYYGASGVIDSIDDFIFDETLLLVGEDGANLLNRATPIAFLATGKYWVNNHAHVLDSAGEGMLRYLALFINAIDLTQYVTGTAQPKMNQAKMNMIPIALPPMVDQERIVTKVEQLMSVCDALEVRLRESEQHAAELAEAVVQEIVA